MSGFGARWPTVRTYEVVAPDVAANGCIANSGLARWVDEVSAAYLDGRAALHEWCAQAGIQIVVRGLPLPPAARLGAPTAVIASAGQYLQG